MKKLLFLLLVAFTFTNCNKNSVQPAYSTTWKGNYTGSADYGTLNFTISSGNKISGTATTSSNFSSPLEGFVTNNNQFSASVGNANTGSTFIGTINGNTAGGTWKNNNNTDNGKWTAYIP